MVAGDNKAGLGTKREAGQRGRASADPMCTHCPRGRTGSRENREEPGSPFPAAVKTSRPCWLSTGHRWEQRSWPSGLVFWQEENTQTTNLTQASDSVCQGVDQGKGGCEPGRTCLGPNRGSGWAPQEGGKRRSQGEVGGCPSRGQCLCLGRSPRQGPARDPAAQGLEQRAREEEVREATENQEASTDSGVCWG